MVKALFTKAHSALVKKGSQDKTYLKLQQQSSDELLYIRFTSKTIERLCDSLRGMVEYCNTELGLSLFPDEVTAMAAVLDRDHYHFESRPR